MKNKEALENGFVDFINSCADEHTIINELLHYEYQYLSGVIDISCPKFTTVLERISKINQNTLHPKKGLENHPEFKAALTIFNKCQFERALAYDSKLQTTRECLFTNEAIFRYCTTLFFSQVAAGALTGSDRYKLQHLTKHTEKIQKFQIELAKHWDFDTPSEIKVLLPKNIAYAISKIQALGIKSVKGGNRKVATYIFQTIFEQHFEINTNNRGALDRITFHLTLMHYPDTTLKKVNKITKNNRNKKKHDLHKITPSIIKLIHSFYRGQ